MDMNEEWFGSTIAYIIWGNEICVISDGRGTRQHKLDDKSIVFDIGRGNCEKLRVIKENYIGMITGLFGHGHQVLDEIEYEYTKHKNKKGIMEIVKDVREKRLQKWQGLNPGKDFPSIVGIVGFSKKRDAKFKAIGFKNTYSKPTEIQAGNGTSVKVGALGSGGSVANEYLKHVIPKISDIGQVYPYHLRSVTMAAIKDPCTGGKFLQCSLSIDGIVDLNEDRPYLLDVIRMDYGQLQDEFRRCLLVITEGIEPIGQVEGKFIKTVKEYLDGVSGIHILGMMKVRGTWKTVRIIRFKANKDKDHALENIVPYTREVLKKVSYKQVNFEKPSLDVFSALCEDFRGNQVR